MEESFKGWPPCDICGKPVDKENGVLSVNPNEAEQAVLRAPRGVLSFEEMRALPEGPKWLWSHARCGSDANVVWIEAERFDSLGKMFDHTLHLSEKNWYQATNWRETAKRFYNVPSA